MLIVISIDRFLLKTDKLRARTIKAVCLARKFDNRPVVQVYHALAVVRRWELRNAASVVRANDHRLNDSDPHSDSNFESAHVGVDTSREVRGTTRVHAMDDVGLTAAAAIANEERHAATVSTRSPPGHKLIPSKRVGN